jgi:RNA polymerase sigma-70 factor (ECF subfamily)
VGHRYDALSDADLLTRGEPEAFAAFYRRHVGGVLAFHRRRVGGAEVALDLAAETFARALEKRSSYRPGPEPASAWLYAIARNLLIDSLRRGRVEDDARRRLGFEPLVLTEAGFDAVEAAIDAAAEPLPELCGDLSDDQALAIRRRVVEDREYAEIADELACSPQVARQHVSRGLKSLRQRMENGA